MRHLDEKTRHGHLDLELDDVRDRMKLATLSSENSALKCEPYLSINEGILESRDAHEKNIHPNGNDDDTLVKAVFKKSSNAAIRHSHCNLPHHPVVFLQTVVHKAAFYHANEENVQCQVQN